MGFKADHTKTPSTVYWFRSASQEKLPHFIVALRCPVYTLPPLFPWPLLEFIFGSVWGWKVKELWWFYTQCSSLWLLTLETKVPANTCFCFVAVVFRRRALIPRKVMEWLFFHREVVSSSGPSKFEYGLIVHSCPQADIILWDYKKRELMASAVTSQGQNWSSGLSPNDMYLVSLGRPRRWKVMN